ncbi:MAG: DUF2141 domain-containing protein [Calditrichaeota bacterium]|nr:MAG: DUF2141 domain-containing protein [Calditrichota bacterium]
MKKIFLSSVMVFLISSNLWAAQNEESKQIVGNMTIIVSGLKNNNGNVKIGLFNSKESYNGDSQLFKGANIKIENKQVKWEVKNIPFGEYAIKAFHDEDIDDKMDTNFLGIPTESYGFSNNAKARFGPPSFDEAKFYFDTQDMQIDIEF